MTYRGTHSFSCGQSKYWWRCWFTPLFRPSSRTDPVGREKEGVSTLEVTSARAENYSFKFMFDFGDPWAMVAILKFIFSFQWETGVTLLNFCGMFLQLMHVDQILLLKAACLEIMILRTALRYDRISASLPFKNGVLLNQYYFACGWDQNDTLLRPLFSLALGLAEVYLDEPEVAVMMGLLLVSGEFHSPQWHLCGSISTSRRTVTLVSNRANLCHVILANGELKAISDAKSLVVSFRLFYHRNVNLPLIRTNFYSPRSERAIVLFLG